MSNQPAYTDKQKEELTRLFAGILYDAMWEARPAKMGAVAAKLLSESRKHDWFQYEGNEYGVLRHMEDAGVYGIFDFFPDKQAKLYLYVFSVDFRLYANRLGLPKEKFVNGLANPKSRATKPTLEVMRGDVSATGNKRMNMRGSLSGR